MDTNQSVVLVCNCGYQVFKVPHHNVGRCIECLSDNFDVCKCRACGHQICHTCGESNADIVSQKCQDFLSATLQETKSDG